MEYKTIIGLEIHVELNTKTKIFCSCSTKFDKEPNIQCCPVCLGLPGALPVLNKKVVEFGIKTGLALNCVIADESKLDRKNYFYPDLPKGYQISQYDKPICTDGYLEIDSGKCIKKIGIKRIHIEEDAGKTIYSQNGDILLDYNRAGMPLIEIVTKPDLNSSQETYNFLNKFKSILEYIEVSDCKMEEGSLRCDVNINVVNSDKNLKSNIVEIKNLNSFKAVVKAIEFEEKRHIRLLSEGKNTIRETRRWDEKKNETVSMRKKEEVYDYRYFREPDIVMFNIEKSWIESIKKTLPELPHDKKERFIREYKLPEYDAQVIVSSKKLADFFENTVKEVKNSKLVSNWIMTEFLRLLKEFEIDLDNIKFSHEDFVELLKFIENGVVNNNLGKKVLSQMFKTGKSPKEIIKEKNLEQITDRKTIEKIVVNVIRTNQKSVQDYRNGKERALAYIIGQVMKETKGKANPQLVNKIIKELI
ncbi:Asp-tRNA(Asn)/Glu-tRNA(Gln) amidotransferase subunit GatB [Caminicella sporogenes]|uniref:Asp-tRNA(Asn)/Glu-tRNA(Gln) amidotransferase subunit GatB n=1 Tax=Caminicella sporogenes TaxID=166485 RepID=UPI0025409602|nr:Asp-tRNA(Asn)/Glu-tRNA(Gln) amidotransferase subunit GatB [Caminicella sporogenes]WIF94066.1 Asp-tRNA(Asn)/Glu-tRNA(Gln) amidotransferase subunit GatB [Caminicella sporogenes]